MTSLLLDRHDRTATPRGQRPLVLIATLADARGDGGKVRQPLAIAPRAWNISTIARPIPLSAPVTRATLPSTSFGVGTTLGM